MNGAHVDRRHCRQHGHSRQPGGAGQAGRKASPPAAARLRAAAARPPLEALERRVLMSTTVGAVADAYVLAEHRDDQLRHGRHARSQGQHRDERPVDIPPVQPDRRPGRRVGQAPTVRSRPPELGRHVRHLLVGYSTSDVTWSETGVNWNNRPTTGTTTLDTETVDYNGNVDEWHEWDVGSYVAAQKAAGATLVTLALKAGNVTDSKASFASREASANQPQLVLTPTADFQQDANNRVVMEAENYSGTLAQGSRSWTSFTTGSSSRTVRPPGESGQQRRNGVHGRPGADRDAAAGLRDQLHPDRDALRVGPRPGGERLRRRGLRRAERADRVEPNAVINNLPTSYAWKGDDGAGTPVRVTVNVPTAGVHTPLQPVDAGGRRRCRQGARHEGLVVHAERDGAGGEPTPTPTPTSTLPTVATAAAASSSTVTGTSVNLSVLGADETGANLT